MKYFGKSSSRLERAERELREFARRYDLPAEESGRNTKWRQSRLARTCAVEASYPTAPANVFAIEFLDVTYTTEPGDRALSVTSRGAAHTVVYSWNGYLPEGTVLEATVHRRYWYTEAIGYRWIMGQTVSTVSSGSAFDIDNIVVMEGADPRDDPESSSETVECENAFGFVLEADAAVAARYSEHDGLWYAIQGYCEMDA